MFNSIPFRIALCLVWLLAAVAGIRGIVKYENAAGQSGETPEHWPAGTGITPDSGHDTIVMFAHPQCPCTRASLGELNGLLARCNGNVTAHVFFFKPKNYSDEWTQTDLWCNAAAIPGITVHEDVDGAAARKFGAETSGYVVLYDIHGQLLFKGGITSGRGHAGDNVGEDTIISLLAGKIARSTQTPVYGCSLVNKSLPQNGVTQ
jgi:hypothetical protein